FFSLRISLPLLSTLFPYTTLFRSPSSRLIHKIKLSAKLKYKLAIKDAFIKHDCQYNDELYNHFLNKRIPEFWKSWNKKMHCNVTDRKSTRLNSSHRTISYAVFCLK